MKSLNFFAAALAATALPLPAAAATDPVAAEQTARFSVEVVGEGPDVILVPGLTSPRSVWDDTVALLKDDYRLHLVEVAGFGDTPAGPNGEGDILPHLVAELADYAATLDAPTLVGHSMGGFSGLTLALDHPEAIGKLVIVDSLPFFSVIMNPNATAETAEPQAAMMRQMMVANAETELPAPDCEAPSMQARGMSKDPAGQCKVDLYAASADRRVTGQLMYEIMTTDLRDRVAELSVPTAMFYPFDPPMLPAERAAEVYGTAYGEADAVTLIPVEGSRHFIMFDQPAFFHEKLAEFLAN
ncbi:alpha/beta fold hydrolase [Sphingomicrobium clamense]|uniref:Alpha/beta hydrolase n=1 Tax=Sphingomicrobium clamense TaxID=2851013 RepID=A0ABS6V3I5_9SPHN|nr:alpha/beta hydrolase [Sphingomicrobium sp. B8]MBW0144109.1 alpha/beta hydrolase [Sphingomicrobium sp. B8]